MTNSRTKPKLLSQALTVFLHFSRSQNLSETARHFGVSVSSASRHISALEKELNLELVDRSRKPLNLSKHGIMLAQSIAQKVNDIQVTVEQIQGSSSIRPDLRIAFLESFVHFSVDFILSMRAETHQIVALSGTTDRLKELLRQNIVDLIVTSDPSLEMQGLSRVRLLREHSVLVIPQSLQRIPRGESWSWQRLTFCGLPYIRSYNQSASGKDVDHFRIANNIPLTSTLEVDSVRTKIALIGQGLGWTILPAMSLFQNQDLILKLIDRGIAVCPMPHPKLERDIYLLAHQSTNVALMPKITSALPDLLRTKVKPWFDTHFPWIEFEITGEIFRTGDEKLPPFRTR